MLGNHFHDHPVDFVPFTCIRHIEVHRGSLMAFTELVDRHVYAGEVSINCGVTRRTVVRRQTMRPRSNTIPIILTSCAE